MRLMGYSGRQLPSGIVSMGPCVGPPDLIRSPGLTTSLPSSVLSGAGLLVVVGAGLLVVVGAGLLVVMGDRLLVTSS